MILPEAVNRYRQDVAESLEWLKDVPEVDLDARLRDEGFASTSPLPMWKHQKVCALLGIAYPAFPFFVDMGLGKSRITLDLFYHFAKRKKENKTGLILVPNLPNIENWKDQIQEHTPDLRAEYLYGSGAERLARVGSSNADLFVINYAGLVSMASTATEMSESARTKRKNSPKRRYIPDPAKLKILTNKLDFLIFDESTEFKNHATTTYQVCEYLARFATRRYGLTGTPFGRSPHDLWAQYYVLDRGKTFGSTLGMFRTAYFTTKRNYWGGWVYKFEKKREPDLVRKLVGSSMRYHIEECLDLPPSIASVQRIFPSRESFPYYKTVHGASVTNARDRKTIETHFMRLRMIASGFLEYGEDEERIEIVFKDNPKRDALLEKILEMPDKSKAVIFHFFVRSGELVSNALTKIKIKHARIFGGTKDKAAELRKFLDNPTCRALIINEDIGALGLNLQVANHLMFYESPISPIPRQQAEARCRRPGQEKTVFISDFTTVGTVEEVVYAYMKEGKDLLRELLDKGEMYNQKELESFIQD